MRHRTWIFVVAPLLTGSPHAWAQDPTAVRRTVVEALETGQDVRVEVARGIRVQGRFAFRSDTAFTLARDEQATTIRLTEVERLWVRGRATGTGALVGAAVGLVAGAVYGGLIGQVACEPVDGGDCSPVAVAALVGLVGGAGGAAVGAGVGYLIPVWRMRFP